MNTLVKLQIIREARANPSEEICGLIVYKQGFVCAVSCPNIALPEDRMHSFEIDSQDYIGATQRGTPCAIYHSHTSGPAAFSQADLEMADELELPLHLVVLRDGEPEWLTYIPKTYNVPLTGRLWAWGESDCYETIRIYYRQELGVYLPDHERDEMFRASQSSAIVDRFEQDGFVSVSGWSDVQRHDVLVFNGDRRLYPHHLGVFVGKSRMLHQPYGRLSRIENIGPEDIGSLYCIARHVSQIRSPATKELAVATP